MLTVFVILAFIALGCTLAAINNKVPLWVAVLFLVLIELLRAFPAGK